MGIVDGLRSASGGGGRRGGEMFEENEVISREIREMVSKERQSQTQKD